MCIDRYCEQLHTYSIYFYHNKTSSIMQSKEQQKQKMQEIINTVISKCWEDESFKKEVINDSVSAITKLTGEPFTIPAGKKFVAVDQTAENTIYLNIPPMPDLDSLELSDEALEQVAGGVTPTTLVLFTYFAAAATVGGLVGEAWRDY